MRKVVFAILLLFCSMAFAEHEEIPSVNYTDSAAYYESEAVRLKTEADSLSFEATGNIVFGIVGTVLGGAGTIWSTSKAKGSLEGGGIAMAFILIPSVCLLAGGVMGFAEGMVQSVKANGKTKESEKHRNTAEEFRAKTQQVKVDFIPIIDPFQKSVGALLAFSF
ncbi:hypothetical protein [Fibrobacter sp.]|uniref:hypothetical protein n=1 Tax=Fibrobacter sp. TaxID=35828 RepID=UPI003868165E